MEALRHLRADFASAQREGERAETEAADKRAAAEGRDAARLRPTVRAVRLAAPGGVAAESLTIAPGDELSVHVEIVAPDGLDDWVFGLGFTGPLGQSVFDTNSHLLGVTLPPFRGVRTFVVRLGGLWLGEGRYTGYAAVAGTNLIEMHRLQDGAELVVEADGRAVGTLYASATIELPDPPD